MHIETEKKTKTFLVLVALSLGVEGRYGLKPRVQQRRAGGALLSWALRSAHCS